MIRIQQKKKIKGVYWLASEDSELRQTQWTPQSTLLLKLI